MKKIIGILLIMALLGITLYGCSDQDQAQQVETQESLEAAQDMSDDLHHMNSFNDSIAHHTGAPEHHFDSLYHHHDSLFVHHHQSYHHSTTAHHTVAQQHEYDSISAVHHHLAH